MQRSRLAFAALVPAVLLSLLALPAQAAGKEPSAEEIVEKALNRGAVGFQQGTATLRMTIVTTKGDAKERTLEIRAMKDGDGLLKSMVKFSKPADVSGTAFLVLQKKDALPDQYVYVPKAKVVRRIAAGNATSTFFGSDFTYADLMPLPVSEKDKVAVEKLPDGTVGGQAVYILQVTPKVEGSPYGRVIAYVQKELMVPLKIEFFDPQNQPLKSLLVRKLQKINVCPENSKKKDGCEQHVPMEVEMKATAGSRTELVVEKVDPNAALTESDFTEEAMQR
ncbi:MAG: outer membrane lipoprotein-sorting protein [Deltaproteobacteria bacterium]|nr:outer membrane lipoprotein-sorting protein [Deltaproteobacteria bacterium]